MKFVIFSIFLALSLTSCAYKNPINGSNNFHSLVSKLVDESASKIKRNISPQEVVLVSDFVNLDKLKNKSQLGFLLSSMLKDSLVSQNIIVREIELGKEFEFGANGFNLLTRNKDNIASNKITKEKYAVVGTYSLTSKSLNVFIKLIDIRNGNILSSSYERTEIDDEILDLEGERLQSEKQQENKKPTPSYRPHVVL
ncbi:FlgO family outer membrane protein [Arcobacter suis]|uniref:FlgO family outer membrane protein n=1 Tax=Arcobacter suis TaxID=1278212 RepID=UPI001D0131FA|nr:FlgO family outer membrane protein [Arcobacter suis]